MGNMAKTQNPFWSQVGQGSQLLWAFIIKTQHTRALYWRICLCSHKIPLTSLLQICIDVSRATSIFTNQSPGQRLLYLEIMLYTLRSPSTLLSAAPRRCWTNFLSHLQSNKPQLYQRVLLETDPAPRQCCLHKKRAVKTML